MSKSYDTSSVLSIVAANEFEPTVVDLRASKPIDSAVELPEIECFDLEEDLFLFGFNQDPYDVTHEAYWRAVFRG